MRGDALVDLGQARAEPGLDGIAQHVARDQEGQRRAQARREGHDHGTGNEAEDCPGSERQDRRHRNRERGHRDVDDEEGRRDERRPGFVERCPFGLARANGVQIQIALEAEAEVRDNEQREHRGEDQLLLVHAQDGC